MINHEIVRPRDRKYAEIHTLYMMWVEINKLKTRMSNRMGAAERGDSNIDTEFVNLFVNGGGVRYQRVTKSGNLIEEKIDNALGLEGWQEIIQDKMHRASSYHPMWSWLTGMTPPKDSPYQIKYDGVSGIAGNNASKLLALVDDIERFPTIASLWRYAGYGIFDYWVDEAGKIQAPKQGYKSKRETVNGEEVTVRWFENAEPKPDWKLVKLADPQKSKRPKGWNAPDNTILKSHLYVINEGMLRAGKSRYVDMYRPAKEKYLAQGKSKMQSHLSGFRIMSKELLKDFWLTFRQAEGLPISDGWT